MQIRHSTQAHRQIVQVLRNDVVGGQDGSLLFVQYRRDADVLLRPPLILRHRLQKSFDMLLEVVHIGHSFLGDRLHDPKRMVSVVSLTATRSISVSDLSQNP